MELTKKYGTFTAVDKLNLNIPAGEIYGFLGPNGAGKTSTILMLMGITKPNSGEILLFDEKYSSNRLDLRKKIGVVPENHPVGIWAWMSGFDYLKMFADLFQVENSNKRIEYLLDRVNLSKEKNKKITEYSRGMLQKLSIVRAFPVPFRTESCSLENSGKKYFLGGSLRYNYPGKHQ